MFNADTHIKDYFNILWRRKWIIISFFIITVTTITTLTFMQDKIYKATATVIVDVRSPDVLSVKDVVKLGESNYWAYRSYIETQKEIIRSRRTANAVMKNLKLARRKKFRKARDPIGALLKQLNVELVRDTRIIRIHAYDKDPKLASLIANNFAKTYADSNISLKIQASSQAEAWLKDEVEMQKKKVEDSELKLQAYKEQNDIVSIENQENMVNSAFTKLNTNYLDTQQRRIKAETAYKTLLDKKGGLALENLPAPLTENQALKKLKEDYKEQEALLVEYDKIYKHKHPKMIRLLENINYLDSHIKKELETEYNNAVNEIEAEYQNSLEEENKLKKELGDQRKRALGLERKIINYNVLRREVETNERILAIVLNRLKETSISSQVQTNNVRVQDLAQIPRKPVRPRKRLNMALAIILGSIGGAGLALFREYMDVSLKDPSEIAALLQLPVLGSVPRIRRDGKNIRKKMDIDHVVEKDSHSLASEAYRTIRTNLLFSINHSNSAKSIVITSSVPKEGKTITAVSLATMIANSGESVLLVDADMRKPRIHTIFNDGNESGLSDFLLGKKGLEEICKYSGINNLYIVTTGKNVQGPAELLSSKNMKLFIEKASSKFSKIIFDTPPIALVTDAAILSSLCTDVVLVTEGGRTTKPLLNNSKELLQKVNANIVGIIVNNVSLTKNRYTYPQYYYNKYYAPV